MSMFLNLYSNTISITPTLKIHIPTIGEILDFGEDEYYRVVSLLVSTPYDLMAFLADLKIYYDEIEEFELFSMIFPTLTKQDVSLILPGVDPSKIHQDVNPINGNLILKDCDSDITIDRYVYCQMAEILRDLHGIEYVNKKPGNKVTRKFLIDRARLKRRRRLAQNKKYNYLNHLIVAAVNNSDFKYDFEGVKKLTIYMFNQSINQLQKLMNFKFTMFGGYSGVIDLKKIDTSKINWLSTE